MGRSEESHDAYGHRNPTKVPLIALAILLIGCAQKTNATNSPVDEPGEETTRRNQTSADLIAAIEPLRKNAKSYYTTEQLYSEPNGDHPWHRADPSDEGKLTGLPVPFEHYVFPGGSEALIQWMPDGSYQGTSWADAVAARVTGDSQVRIDFEFWELIYSTSGVGLDATANWIARSRTNPERFVRCDASLDPNTSAVLLPQCETFGF